MKTFKDTLPEGFARPNELPASGSQHDAWQQHNRNWWEGHPMRYDWKEQVGHWEFSREFYAEIDKRFYDSARLYMPWKKVPFDALIDFDSINTMDVLEIGCGNGSHGQLLASRARSYTGIDITEYAVKSTSERMRVFELPASIQHMDAERMQFPADSFDYIWTWGVIHHSADTRRVLEEMNRVLRPGGRATVMVYQRSFWNYYTYGIVRSLQRRKLPLPQTIHESVQLFTDGALARYYSPSDWRGLVDGLFKVTDIRIYGQKSDLVFLPGGALKDVVLRLIPNRASRFLVNRCRMGNFLVAHMEKS